MKTDHALGELFASDPDLIKLFVKVPETCHYRVKSEVTKEIERRIDVCFIPDREDQPIIVCELQGYNDEGIYYRLLTGTGMVGERNPKRKIHALLIFLDQRFDPKTQPWHGFGRQGSSGFQVAYLAEIVAQLHRHHPNHPAATLFEVLIESDEEKLKAQSRRGYQTIQRASLPEPLRETY